MNPELSCDGAGVLAARAAKADQRMVTDINTLEAELNKCLAQGYSLDLEENEVGVNGIATPIVDGMGEIAAAISVCGPSNRLTEDVMEQIAPDVIAAAHSISIAIGGQGPTDEPASRSR